MVWPTIFAAAVGAGASLYGAKKDRDASEENQDKSQAYLTASSQQARQDVERLFGNARTARTAGFDTTRDIFQQFVPQQVEAFQHGNYQAQGTVGNAAQQQVNAIMGSPVDFSFLQPQQAYQPDYSFMDFQTPIPDVAPTQGTEDAAAIRTQVDDHVFDAYRTYLGRDPDPAGMDIYRRVVMDGNNYATTSGINRMIQAIQKSPEGQAYAQSQPASQGFGQLTGGGL